MNQPDPIAVLTGDIVGSRRLGPELLEAAMACLEAKARDMEDWHGAPLRFSRNRGDGWQVVLARPERALRTALAFRATLRTLGKAVDSRMAIAEGVSALPAADDLNAASGAAFVASGTALDALGRATRLTHASGGALAAVALLADRLSRRWTPAQARAILPALDPDAPPTLQDIATGLGITRQAVGQALAAAAIPELLAALALVEKVTP